MPEVVEQKGGKHHGEECDANRPLAKVSEVRVQRLGAGYREKHGAENHETHKAVNGEEADGIPRVHGREDSRMLNDLQQAERSDRGEPHHCDRTERFARGPAALYRE